MSEKVAIGFHTFGTCTTGFAISLAGLCRYSGTMLSSLIHLPSPYVTEARNKIVVQFLKTKADYLLMVDADMQFQEDALLQTYFAAKRVGADVMFGTYALGDFRPSIFYPPVEEGHQLPTVVENLGPGQILEVYAGATGWLLMHRDAANKIAEANASRHWKWFDHDIEWAGPEWKSDLGKPENNTIRMGEDFSFSKRAREAGLKLWGTTIPLLIHDKYQPLIPWFQESTAKALGMPIRGGKFNAVGSGSEQVQEGGSAQRIEERPEGSQPQASDSDHAVGEEGCCEGQERVQT